MNKIKKKIYKFLRNKILKDITNNLGEIKETDDKIICYVDNKKLKKYREGKYIPYYELIIKSKKRYPEDTLNVYNVNKPIHYIIKGKEFQETILVFAPIDTTIAFIDCIFNDMVTVHSRGDVILENNQYHENYEYNKSNLYFCDIESKSLKILNENFTNKSKYDIETFFGMRIDTDNLEIINSTFDIKKKDRLIFIRAKDVYIEDSNIKCYNPIYIQADKLKIIGTKIKSQTEVVIDNKNNNYIFGITSPKTIYNGVDLTKHFSLNPKNLELQKSRITLVEKLRELRDKCVSINLTELKEVEKNLNKRSVVKIIKK